jgi:isopenicillin N synthase-like dioxygenase
MKTCHEFHVSVMRAIALGLELEESFFDDKFDQQFHDLRLLHYLPVKRALLQGTGERAGAHSGRDSLASLPEYTVDV